MPDSILMVVRRLQREWGVHVVANAPERNSKLGEKWSVDSLFCGPKRLTKIGPFPLKLPALNMVD
jgi:hypothetical protein